jgi:hypothetical protein
LEIAVLMMGKMFAAVVKLNYTVVAVVYNRTKKTTTNNGIKKAAANGKQYT